MTRLPTRRLLALALASAARSCLAQPAIRRLAIGRPQALDGPFTVSDIRVDGLQRISAGTVFTYLPVERGDTHRPGQAPARRSARCTRPASSRTCSLDRQGDILVVTVVERPAINKLTITGNKDIKTEDLMKGLKDIGLAEGDTFDRLALDRVTQELTRQYNNRGKYNVEITPDGDARWTATASTSTITIKEGKAAKIRHINLVGNEKFEDKDILDSWESSEHNWLQLVPPRRPVLAREALRRPGEAQQLLPRPRLRRLQRRLHPGLDQPRPPGHVHHRRRDRGRAVQGLRGQGHRRHRAAARSRSRQLVLVQGRPDLLAPPAGDQLRRDHRDAGQHRLRLRRRSTRSRTSTAKTKHRRHQPAGRARPARQRAPHRLQGQHPHRRRSAAPRDAPVRGQLVLAGRDRPLQDPPAAPGLLRDRRHRDPAGRRHQRPGRRGRQRQGNHLGQLRVRPGLLAAAAA